MKTQQTPNLKNLIYEIIYHFFKIYIIIPYPPAQEPEDEPLCSRHSAAVKHVPFLYFWPEALQTSIR